MLAGDTTRLRLADMAKGGMLCEGDVWLYCRAFKGGLTIKKELTVRTPSVELTASALGSIGITTPFHSDAHQGRKNMYVQD
jgi:hypothetical protein